MLDGSMAGTLAQWMAAEPERSLECVAERLLALQAQARPRLPQR